MSMMTTISVALAWGGLLSLLHFGGLRLSLEFLPRVARPHLWFYGGLLLRYTITLSGMWQALQYGPPAIMAACGGFYTMRMILIPRLSGLRS